jgi:sugar fermentation stimulation protein A
MGVVSPGRRVWLRPEPPRPKGPPRRTRFTWVLVRHGRHWVGIDTLLPNRLCHQAVAADALPGLRGYASVRREVPYGERSRVDLLLEGPRRDATGRLRRHRGRGDQRSCYVEIKNCHLTARTLDPGIAGPVVPRRHRGQPVRDIALFPDAPTARGRRHLYELAQMVRQGHRAVLLVVVQRNDCDAFSAAAGIDPAYAAAMAEVAARGVEIHAWACRVSPAGVRLARPVPVLLEP